MTEVPEMHTLAAWVAAPWFARTLRIYIATFVTFTSLVSAFVGWAVWTTKDDLEVQAREAVSVRAIALGAARDIDGLVLLSAERERESEAFREVVTGRIDSVTTRIDRISRDIGDVKGTLGRIEGVVTQMNRRDLAVGYNWPGSAAAMAGAN